MRAGNAWVFPANRGKKSYHGMNHEAVRIFRTANPENVTCHTLRHAYASYVSELGYSDGTIGGLLGTWAEVSRGGMFHPNTAIGIRSIDDFSAGAKTGSGRPFQSPLLRSWLTVATTASIAPRFAPIFR